MSKQMTIEDKILIQKCLTKGIRQREIAKLIGVSESSISTEISNNGGKHKYNAIESHTRLINHRVEHGKNCLLVKKQVELSKNFADKEKQLKKKFSYILLNQKNYLNLEERKVIKELIDQHHSYHAISRIVNRSYNCVGNEIRKNGGRESYDPEKAHQNFLNNMRQKMRRNSNSIENSDFETQKNSQQIENLQMQIDILLETIEEMRKK